MPIFINNLIKKIENGSLSFYSWGLAFLSIIVSRVLMENWLGGMVNKTGDYFFHHIAYTFVFFLLSYLIFLIILIKNLKIEIKQAANIMLWGYLIIIIPPLIDFILLKDKLYLSFYGIYGLAEMPKRFFTFFGDSPDFGITYGVRFEIAFTAIALIIYGYLKTKNKIKALFLGLQAYFILFILGTFPSWVTIIKEGFLKGFLKINETDIVQMFFTSAKFFSRDTGTYLNALSIKLTLIYAILLAGIILVGLFFYFKKELISFLKNCRPVQMIYHQGLLFVGIGLGIIFTEIDWDFNFFNLLSFLNISIAIILAWLASVVFNDVYDRKIDSISNNKRPLIKEDFSQNNYLNIGGVLFMGSVFYAAIINPKVAFLVIAYQALAWIYSAWPFRLKRFPLMATLVSALASMAVVFSGFILVSPAEDILEFPKRIFWLILIALIFALPIKDLKDIDGDRADGVYTIPVIFGEYWGKIIVSSGIFIAYFLSVIFLNEYRLMLWAIILGGASFWIVIASKKEGRLNNNYNVIWWILGLLAIYLMILTIVIF